MLRALVQLIAEGEDAEALAMLDAQPELAEARYANGATRQAPRTHFFAAIGHYAYEGDTALHLAAAAHRPVIVRRLIELGADVHARNRRKAQPLHYAVDGGPGWRTQEQAEVVRLLIAAGAEVDAVDQGGVTPLHRAVRNRCAEAVAALLAGGADPRRTNGAGSTPMRLAEVTSGRGGTGRPEARAAQARIVALLDEALRQA
jgi:hypothetical protein